MALSMATLTAREKLELSLLVNSRIEQAIIDGEPKVRRALESAKRKLEL